MQKMSTVSQWVVMYEFAQLSANLRWIAQISIF